MCGSDHFTQPDSCCPGQGLTCTFSGGNKYFFGCGKTYQSSTYLNCGAGSVLMAVNAGTRYACVEGEPTFTQAWPYEYDCVDPVCLNPPCI